MNKKSIDNLHCIYCGGGLHVARGIYVEGGKCVHAIVSCPCSQYPLLSGVLFLNKDRTAKKALEFVRRNEKWLKKWSYIPLFLLRHPFFATKILLTTFSVVNFFSLLSFRNFVYVFKLFGFYESGWGEYLLGRSKDKNLRAAILCLGDVKKNTIVLDAASGAGHFLAYLRKRTNEENIWGVDSSIVNIYLSKQYFAPKANYIYLSLENGLPFKKQMFDSVFMNDALHYIKRKRSLCKNLDTATKKRGKIILSNLHNKRKIKSLSRSSHFPEYLETYLKLFSSRKFEAFSEDNLGRNRLQILQRGKLDSLSRKTSKFTLIFS